MAKVFTRTLDSNRDGFAFEKEENGDKGSARCLRLEGFVYEFFPPQPGESECRLYRYGLRGRRAGMKVLPAPSLKKRDQLLINFIKKAHREWDDEELYNNFPRRITAVLEKLAWERAARPTSRKVFMHWCKPRTGSIIIADQQWSYVQVMVHSGVTNGTVEPMNIFLLGLNSFDVPEGTPMLLTCDVKGQPLSLADEKGEVLWNAPEGVAPWIALCLYSFDMNGPGDCVGADVIAISNWPGDDWVHIYSPVHLTQSVLALFKRASHIAEHQSAFRAYDLLCLPLDDDRTIEDSLIPVLNALPNAVFLEYWK